MLRILRLNQIDKKMMKALSKLHLPYGVMWEEFKEQLDRENNKARICIFKKKQDIVGWAFAYPEIGKRSPTTYLYVQKKHRSKGIGIKIIKYLMKHYTYKPAICPWDYTSEKFFFNLIKTKKVKVHYMYRDYD